MKYWSTGCAFSIDDIFENFPYKKLKITCNDCEKIINDRHRDKLVKRIFKAALEAVLNDVIDNNATF